MVRIILIRHGETTWNVEGRYQGQEDIPLSPKGIAQGKAAGLALKIYPLMRPSLDRSPVPLIPAVSLPNITM